MKSLKKHAPKPIQGIAAGMAVVMSMGTVSAAPVWANEVPQQPTAQQAAAQPQPAQAEPAQLRSLIFDRAYLLEPTGDTAGKEFDVSGFSSNHFSYKTTIYRTWDTVKIYPYLFASSPDATVTVNNEPVDGKGAFYELNVAQVGTYSVEIRVTEGEKTNSYVIQVDKVDTDYRGRKPIVTNQAALEQMKVVSMTAPKADNPNSSKERLLEVLKKQEAIPVNTLKNNEGVFWQPSDPKTAYFIMDLGDVYDISRIRAMVLPRNKEQTQVKISVSGDNVDWTAGETAAEDPNIHFTTPIDVADATNNTNWHQDTLRYDFNTVYPVRYIKWEISNPQGDLNDLQVHQFMVFEDTLEAPPVYDPPADGSVPWQHEDRHQYLASGQATVIERGYPILGWMPSSGYGRDIPTAKEAEQFGWSGPLFYDPPQVNNEYFQHNPNTYWGLSKAPGGFNGMPNEDPPGPEGRQLLVDGVLPYVRNAVSFCFGDEQNYSENEVAKLKKWFDYTRERLPGVILHTNNRTFDSWSEPNNINHYVETAKPDLLTWDDYYNNENGFKKDGGGAGSFNMHNPAYHGSVVQKIFAVSGKWDIFRKTAHLGVDKTGNQPILYGQYLDSFQTNQPESVKNLIANLSVLAGQKWLNFFRVEYQYDKSFTWDEDGTPTTGLWEWGQITHKIHAVDDWVSRLNNDWILLKKGDGANLLDTASKYRMSDFVPSAQQDNLSQRQQEGLAKQKEYGLKDVEVTVDSTRYQRTKKGDVAIGLAETLPGLYQDEVAEWFQKATAPKAFMIVNGLVDGETGDDEMKRNGQVVDNQRLESSCFKPYVEGRERGTANNTRQTVKVVVEQAFENTPLYRLNAEALDEKGNATVEQVQLMGESGSKYFTAELGGGEMGIYFWGTNTTAAASSQDEHGKQASFAFDDFPATYWQAKDKAEQYRLENTFAPRQLTSVVLHENGNAIEQYTVEYQQNGQWKALSPQETDKEAFTTIGEKTTLVLKTPQNNVTGIRLNVTKAKDGQLPAMYEVDVTGDAQQPVGDVVKVNDNDLGSALYRFEYDDKWSYREVEDNQAPNLYDRGGDGHFAANYNKATAKFRFWGNRVVLDLRQNKMNELDSKLQISLLDKAGNAVDPKLYDKKVDQNAGTVTISMKDGKDGAYAVLIEVKQVGTELGIDGADVTRSSAPANDIVFAGAAAPAQAPYQTYVNDKVQEAGKPNRFAFYNGDKPNETPVVFEKDKNRFYSGISGQSKTEQEKKEWVSYIGKSYEEDGGGARTQKSDYAYTFTFHGTSAAFYAGSYPWGQKKGTYGDFTVLLDGQKLTEGKNANGATLTKTNINDAEWQWSGGSAVQLLKVETGESKDATHTITISNKTVNRIDYAVVGTQEQPVAPPPEAEAQSYKISATPTKGGSVAATVVTAKEGKTVEVAAFPQRGYQLKEGSLKATANGQEVSVAKKEGKENWYQFTMPAGDVVLSSEFVARQSNYSVKGSVDKNQGGTVAVKSQSVPFLGDAVFEITPQEGYRLAAIRVNNVKKPLPDGKTYTITGVTEDINLVAYFEPWQKAEFTVTAKLEGGHGFISPDKQVVKEGSDAQITFKPNKGSQLAQLKVNDTVYPVSAAAAEEGKSVLTLHSISGDANAVLQLASSKLPKADLKAEVQGKGAVWPQNQTVVEGFDGVVLLNADDGYYAKEAIYQGKTYPITNQERFVLEDIKLDQSQKDSKITIVFEQQEYQVEAAKVTGGSVAATPAKAKAGEKITVELAAEQGYQYTSGSLQVLTTEGTAVAVTTVEADKTFTFEMPGSDVKISAQFEQQNKPQVEGIEVTPNPLVLKGIGTKGQLTAKVSPQQAAVKWSVADETIATVDENGMVTAKAEGTTTVFAQAGEVTVPCTVQVVVDKPQPSPNVPTPAPDSKPTPPASSQPSPSPVAGKPQTGDTGSILWAVLASVSGAAALAFPMLNKRSKNQSHQ